MTLRKIKLTAFLHSGEIQGSPGDLVDINEGNLAAANRLIKEKGAVPHLVDGAVTKAQLAKTQESDEEDEDDLDDADDNSGLTDVDDAESVDALDIAPRYKAALRDAGLNTIAEAKAHPDLASVAGLNAKVAKKILES
jgi:hypothetical protein